jgi:SpoVK/Ycf46/Vps4 family AAA+-type ATPase
MGEPQARRVTTRAHTHTADDLQLHYGQDFLDWHLGFLRQLKTRGNGLTVLQGEPGVGKTSYLRSLMAELRLSHKFFYIPITSFGLLATPACTDFWLAQNERHKALRSVCVIEDGDMLLAKRGADNQQLLSDLLNLSDGFLADTLRVQIIVTVNSEIDQLDPAVVRPGRLQAARKFRRLSPAEAEKIAAKRKLKLPPQESYSLGEIYNAYSGAADTLSKRAGVGFMHL